MKPRVLRPLLFGALGLLIALAAYRYSKAPPQAQFAPGSKEFLTNAVRMLAEHEAQMAGRYWGPELIAQKHGLVFDNLWDALNGATNKFEVLRRFNVSQFVRGRYDQPKPYEHGIRVFEPSSAEPLNNEAWRALLTNAEGRGWELEQCEFRHIGFRPQTPRESVIYFSAHLTNPATEERAILEGNVLVRWEGDQVVREVDASKVEVRVRQGKPPFRMVFDEEIKPQPGSYFIDPLIIWDLNEDGAAEIILAAKNQYYSRTADGDWRASVLCEDDPRLIFTAILGDFNGDGEADFLNARFDGLFLHEGAGGRFPGAARFVWAAQPRLKYAQVMTSGDIDSDGDLDLYLGQYKVPYDKGQMPFPYFDANDGNRSFLLLNDGKGNFSDGTDQAGLGMKRHRRIYSSSLVDLDGDRDLDLLLVSDFNGLDAFENNGAGKFSEATGKWFAETRGLGMAHAFADFDGDSRMDILMIGMNSPVVDRLESMGLSRPYDVADAGMRKRVAYGNRLYFGEPDGTYRESAVSLAVARTGWSWGVATSDFDGNGLPDLYIANGHETRASVRDYETEFWLHDIYVSKSQDDLLANAYFQGKFRRTRGAGWSYGGYEKNRLFLTFPGRRFVEVGYLFGLALEADSRNAALLPQRNGATGLVVTTFEVHPQNRQRLLIYENSLPAIGPTKKRPEFKLSGASYRSQQE